MSVTKSTGALAVGLVLTLAATSTSMPVLAIPTS